MQTTAEKCKSVLKEEEVKEVIKNHLKTSNFSLRNFVIKPASDNLMGFLGEHYKINAKVEVDGENRELSYFVKKIPTEVPQHLEYALKTKAFYKEVEMYKTLFVDMKNAQKNAQNPTKWCPEYYYSREAEIFVLEDLSTSGYYMYPERCLMDEEHVKMTLKALAAMHASSFVFEEMFNSGKVQSLSPTFGKTTGDTKATIGDVYSHLTFETEASDEKGHPGNTYHEAGIKSQIMVADMLPGYTNEERQKIREKLPDVLRHSLQLVKTSHRFKNVFVHGDLWANNILFRKDPNGKLVDALIIDFQLARYAPPAHDVMMFLHLTQNNDFRRQRQQEMLKYYFNSFTDELAKNSLQVENILPWEIFLESCEFYNDLGLIMKLFYFQLILSPPEISNKFLSTPDLFTKNMLIDRSEMVIESFQKSEDCRARVTEAMKDVINKFILN